MEMFEILKNLCEKTAVGHLCDAADYAKKTIGECATITELSQNCFAVTLKGEKDYTLVLEAHIDEVAFTVTDLLDNGFLRVSACGGIDSRILPAARVLVHGKEKIPAVFCSTPPHLMKGEGECKSVEDMYIDTGIKQGIKDIVGKGDFVTFNSSFKKLCGNRVTAKALDNRAGCAALIELYKRLSGKKLPFNVTFLFTFGEELGLRGARVASFAVKPDSAIVFDVSFGNGPDIPKTKCGKLGLGAMIGISPVINRNMSDALIAIAKDNGIPYQTEVLSESTGTDCDVISICGAGLPTALISVPLRNMHTPNEVLDISDIVSLCDITEKYILNGGNCNA